jgi:hypothetical protein
LEDGRFVHGAGVTMTLIGRGILHK